MPLEVVELVLSHVPLPCLLSTCCLVSRAWRDIISNPLYLPWANEQKSKEAKLSSTKGILGNFVYFLAATCRNRA